MIHFFVLLVVVGNIVLVEVVGERLLDGLLRQHGAVQLVGGQTVQGFGHGLIGQAHGIVNGLALDHLGSHGGGGDSGAAAEGLELHVFDDVVFNFQIDLHDIAALGVAYLAYDEDKNFDLLLLDVEMGGMDGVTMAKRVRAENTAVQIVFITGYTDYIAEGYDVAALHYLVKPVHEEKLFEVLDRAAAKIRSDSRALTLECGGETVRVPLYEIRYLDVEKNYTTVHAKRDYTVKKTLGALSDELDERFFRIGRAAIVNLSYIRRVTKTDAILSDGAAIQLPRGAYEALNRAIIAYH